MRARICRAESNFGKTLGRTPLPEKRDLPVLMGYRVAHLSTFATDNADRQACPRWGLMLQHEVSGVITPVRRP